MAHLYFADPGSRSEGAIASTMIFFSWGVRSRSCDAGVVAGTAVAAAVGVADAAGGSADGVVAHAASARLATSAALTLHLFIGKVTPLLNGRIATDTVEPQSHGWRRHIHFSFGNSALTFSMTAGGVA